MEQSTENKLEIKQKVFNFYNSNKIKLYSLLIIVLLALSATMIIKFKNEKENALIAEKYIEAGILLAADKKNDARKIYEEIISTKNKFYSILSLNSLMEKNLIKDKNRILGHFETLEKIISDKEQRDLILLKKALYLIKVSDIDEGNNLLKSLANKNIILKSITEDLLKNK
tara:strand:+ start:651 stop:1163 length:513 start_codon:yes stop_codon:yes gene_type:complete